MKKILMAAGMILALTTTAQAAEREDLDEAETLALTTTAQAAEREDLDEAETLVNGVVHDVAQKILPVSVEARFFAPHLDMNVKSDRIHYNGGDVGLKDTLGFGNDNAPEFIFRYKRFTADYLFVHGTGSRNFGDSPLVFGGNTFHGDTNSESDFHYLKLNFAHPIVSVLGSGVDWSYGLAGMYWKGTVSNAVASRTKEYGLPIPTVGVGAHADFLSILRAYANISGMTLGGNGHFYDFEAGVRYNPIDIVGINLGYRKIYAKFSHSDDSATVDLDGPYAGLRVDF